MGQQNTTLIKSEEPSKYYITVDDKKYTFDNITETDIQYKFVEMLNDSVFSQSADYNCMLEPIENGYLIFGYPKNQPVSHPRVLNKITYSR